jgi:hypothetical protein
MFNSYAIFTSSGASQALGLAGSLPREEQLVFLKDCQLERTLQGKLLDAGAVARVYNLPTE